MFVQNFCCCPQCSLQPPPGYLYKYTSHWHLNLLPLLYPLSILLEEFIALHILLVIYFLIKSHIYLPPLLFPLSYPSLELLPKKTLVQEYRVMFQGLHLIFVYSITPLWLLQRGINKMICVNLTTLDPFVIRNDILPLQVLLYNIPSLHHKSKQVYSWGKFIYPPYKISTHFL